MVGVTVFYVVYTLFLHCLRCFTLFLRCFYAVFYLLPILCRTLYKSGGVIIWVGGVCAPCVLLLSSARYLITAARVLFHLLSTVPLPLSSLSFSPAVALTERFINI